MPDPPAEISSPRHYRQHDDGERQQAGGDAARNHRLAAKPDQRPKRECTENFNSSQRVVRSIGMRVNRFSRDAERLQLLRGRAACEINRDGEQGKRDEQLQACSLYLAALPPQSEHEQSDQHDQADNREVIDRDVDVRPVEHVPESSKP